MYRKRIVSAIVLIAMLAGMGYIVGFFLKPVQYETDIYASEFDEMKKHDEKVDLVILGTSRIIRSCNPFIFEEKLSLNNVFNLSMNQLDINGCYFQLKEFVEEFHPKTVVLSITHGTLIKQETPIIVKSKLTERLHGLNCLEYINENFSINEYPYIMPLYCYRKNIFNIKQNVKDRLEFQKTGRLKNGKRQYIGKGFAPYTQRVPLGNIGIKQIKKFDKTLINKSATYYLEKCIRLCKDNNIQLIFMTPPTSMAYIYNINNYQEVIDYISNYATKNDIIYHNLNYLKGKEEWLPDSMMNDTDHINKAGSTVVSEKYAEILSKSLKNIDTSEYFYPTLSEMQKDVKRIVAVDAKPVIKNNTMTLSIQSLQNNDVTPYYQVLMAKDKITFNPVINWTSEKNVSFAVPKKGSAYRILLRARRNENDTAYAWMAWDIDKKGKVNKIKNTPVAVR